MIEIFDIETISNLFTYVGLNKDTKEISKFVIHKDRNDLLKFIEHSKKLKGQIGFNNNAFDAQVTQYILNNYKKWLELDGEEVSNLIYQQSQKTIERANKVPFSEFPSWKMNIPQLDLFKIWHFDNKARMTSLKWIEYMIDMDDIQEMPIHHSSKVDFKDIEKVLEYNLHDVKAIYELYKITKGETENILYKGINKLQLRKDIGFEFRINCDNFNDVKIGDQLMKLTYCKVKNIDTKEIPKSNKKIDSFKFKNCFPSYYKFETVEFNNFINSFGGLEVNLKKETKKKQNFEFIFNGTTYIVAKGGLHSKDLPRLIKPNENEILRDKDVGSMYPNAIRKRKLFPRHLGLEWLSGYTDIIQKRIAAKKLFKDTKLGKYKAIDEALKLSLNGGSFGKTNEETNWQYDPKVTMNVTIGSQIDLLMLIEDLELAGIHVVSANTDGLVTLFDKKLNDKYYEVCKAWEKQVGNDILGQLEYQDYKLLVQTSVNDYIAIKSDDSFKTKGDFISDFELHKNKSARIMPLALQQYFINNISIEKFIKEHNNIYNFCLGVKSIGKNRLISLNKNTQIETDLQKINRYYISNTGVHILKKLPKLENKKALMQLNIFGNVDDGTREAEIEAGYVSTVFNRYIKKEMKEYNINYQYYINRCNKIISQIIK